MWTTKVFKKVADMRLWIRNNEYRYQIEEVALENAWGVIYKKLRTVY